MTRGESGGEAFINMRVGAVVDALVGDLVGEFGWCLSECTMVIGHSVLLSGDVGNFYFIFNFFIFYFVSW